MLMAAVASTYPRQCPGPTEAQRFYAAVFHDDRGSNAVLATRRCGLWSERSIPVSQLPYLASSFVDRNDRYVTVNGFIGRDRSSARCRQVNALVVDVDAHGGNHLEAVPALESRLASLQADPSFPSPTVAVATGRGLQLLYVLERSVPCRLAGGVPNEAALSFLADVRSMLFDALDAHLASPVPGATLDRSVSDLSRVVRIPGSFNTAAGCRARLLADDGPAWDLAGLKAALLPLLPGRKPEAVSKRPARLDRLNTSRMRKVRELVALRDSRGQLEGTRDLCLFVYYNAATQVLGAMKARQGLHALNQSTSCPLPVAEVDSIADGVDRAVVRCGPLKGQTGFYPLTAETIGGKLLLTAEEIGAVGFFASKRADERAASKAATKERRRQRDERICRLYGNGLAQARIAERVGCSVRTVAKAVKAAGMRKGALKQAQRERFADALERKAAVATSSACDYALSCHTSRGVVPLLSLSSSVSTFSYHQPCDLHLVVGSCTSPPYI